MTPRNWVVSHSTTRLKLVIGFARERSQDETSLTLKHMSLCAMELQSGS